MTMLTGLCCRCELHSCPPITIAMNQTAGSGSLFSAHIVAAGNCVNYFGEGDWNNEAKFGWGLVKKNLQIAIMGPQYSFIAFGNTYRGEYYSETTTALIGAHPPTIAEALQIMEDGGNVIVAVGNAPLGYQLPVAPRSMPHFPVNLSFPAPLSDIYAQDSIDLINDLNSFLSGVGSGTSVDAFFNNDRTLASVTPPAGGWAPNPDLIHPGMNRFMAFANHNRTISGRGGRLKQSVADTTNIDFGVPLKLAGGINATFYNNPGISDWHDVMLFNSDSSTHLLSGAIGTCWFTDGMDSGPNIQFHVQPLSDQLAPVTGNYFESSSGVDRLRVLPIFAMNTETSEEVLTIFYMRGYGPEVTVVESGGNAGPGGIYQIEVATEGWGYYSRNYNDGEFPLTNPRQPFLRAQTTDRKKYPLMTVEEINNGLLFVIGAVPNWEQCLDLAVDYKKTHYCRLISTPKTYNGFDNSRNSDGDYSQFLVGSPQNASWKTEVENLSYQEEIIPHRGPFTYNMRDEVRYITNFKVTGDDAPVTVAMDRDRSSNSNFGSSRLDSFTVETGPSTDFGILAMVPQGGQFLCTYKQGIDAGYFENMSPWSTFSQLAYDTHNEFAALMELGAVVRGSVGAYKFLADTPGYFNRRTNQVANPNFNSRSIHQGVPFRGLNLKGVTLSFSRSFVQKRVFYNRTSGFSGNIHPTFQYVPWDEPNPVLWTTHQDGSVVGDPLEGPDDDYDEVPIQMHPMVLHNNKIYANLTSTLVEQNLMEYASNRLLNQTRPAVHRFSSIEDMVNITNYPIIDSDDKLNITESNAMVWWGYCITVDGNDLEPNVNSSNDLRYCSSHFQQNRSHYPSIGWLQDSPDAQTEFDSNNALAAL